MKYGKAYGGEDPEMIEGDVFRIIVKVPEFGSQGNVTPEVTEQVKRLLNSLVEAPAGTRNLMEDLQLRHRPTFLYDYLQPALDGGLIEMTQPDSPKSPTQKYRLTDAGKRLLKSMQE